MGAGRASGDEPEDGTAESIERKPVRVREDLTGSHVGSQDDQSAVEDKIGFFSRPYLVRTKKRISSDSDIFWVLEKAVTIQK